MSRARSGDQPKLIQAIPTTATWGKAVQIKSENASLQSILSKWYARNENVMRLWIYADGHGRPSAANRRNVHVVVALAPVSDSDDTGPIWFARSAGWHRQLQQLIGSDVQLHLLDEDTELVECSASDADARVCLASVTWRDPEWSELV